MSFAQKRKHFLDITKRIIKTEISKNQKTLDKYKEDLVTYYNDLIRYTEIHYLKANAKEKIVLQKKLIKPKERLIRAFNLLKINTTFDGENLFSYVETQDTTEETFVEKKLPEKLVDLTNSDSDSDVESEENKAILNLSFEKQNLTENKPISNEQIADIQQASGSNLGKTDNDTKTDQTDSDNSLSSIRTVTDNNDQLTETEMAQTPQEAVKTVSQTITKNFDGNPLQLRSFLTSLNLLNTLIIEANKDVALQAVLSKLEGKALECIPEDVADLDTIRDLLKKFIVHDSSKIVSGKMEALKADRNNLTDFTQKAEELAEALQRSLVVEGISKPKALEMAVDKTIEMCRKSAKTDMVKSVLASKPFTTPKEVVATFIIQNATEMQEKQVLAFHSQNNFTNNKNRGNYRGNFRGNYRGNNRGNYNNYRGRGNFRGNFQNNFRGNYRNNGYQSNYYQSGNNNNNQRGNSNYRGNNYRSNNSFRRNNNGNTQNVRAFEENQNSNNDLGFQQDQMNNQQANTYPIHQVNIN